ncbi:MAG TPA: TlpA disulfide reductase family protein, partial [Puia sp.]|nr:TlpA disulfide reductase family protein [Puia sp.]
LQYKGFAGRVYLKAGDRSAITIGRTRAAAADKDQNTYVYRVDGGSAENRLLQEWYMLSLPLTTRGYYKQLYTKDSAGMDAYSEHYARVVTAAAEFRNRIHTGNARFDAWMSLVVDADLAASPLKYLNEMDMRVPSRMARRLRGNGELPVFIKQCLSSGSTVFERAELLRLQGSATWLEGYAQAKLAALPIEERRQMSHAARVAFMVNASGNDTLKGCLLGLQLHNEEALDVNNLSEFRDVVEPLRGFTAYNHAALEEYNALYERYVQDTAIIGHLVNDITLPDTAGRRVSLRGFAGKAVVIDTWATWCGPCKAQIPFLKEVEEAYADNPDVVFIGLSLDRQADEGKWKAMVQQLGLKGIQLIDYSGKTFGWPYGIMAIPRFLVMDKHGVWVEIRCPMPENTEKFKSYIEKAIH